MLTDCRLSPDYSRLLSIKKVTIQKRLPVKLDFTLSKGDHTLKLYFISDSFVGADQVRPFAFRLSVYFCRSCPDLDRRACFQEYDFNVTVAEAADSDEEDSDDDENAMDED